MKRLLDNPFCPASKHAKWEEKSYFDELITGPTEVHDVIHHIVHQILQIYAFQICILACTSKKINGFLESQPYLHRIFCEKNMLRAMRGLQPKGFDEGSIAYAKMLLQMGREDKAIQVELSKVMTRQIFDYKLIETRLIFEEALKTDSFSNFNLSYLIKIEYLYETKLKQNCPIDFFINKIKSQSGQVGINIIWDLMVKLNPQISFNVFEKAVTDKKINIPIFSASQLPHKLIQENWKRSFELCSQLDIEDKKRNYAYYFLCGISDALTCKNFHDLVSISPAEFLLLAAEHSIPKLKVIVYVFVKLYPETSLSFADLKSNPHELFANPNHLKIMDCCSSIYAALNPSKLIDFINKFQRYAQSHPLDAPIKKQLEFYEILKKVMIDYKENLYENVKNLLNTDLFPEIYYILSLYRNWHDSEYSQEIIFKSLVDKLKKQDSYAYNYLGFIACIDIQIALNLLKEIEKENFPKGIDSEIFSESPVRLNILTGCLSIGLMFKICPPQNFKGVGIIAETLIDNPYLPSIIALDDDDDTDDYKEDLLQFFMWCDEHKITEISLCDRFLKKVEAEAAAYKDPILYLWLANKQKFLRKKESTKR